MWNTRNHEESNGYRHCGPRGGHFAGGFGRFGRGFGGRHGGDGHGRRRGLYDSEELRLVLLSLIAEQPRHGYDLIREIEERTGGVYAPSPGIVYPTLTMLQDMGLIAESDTAFGAQIDPLDRSAGPAARPASPRKVYALTPEGTAYLAQHKEAADALLARITELGSAQKGDSAPVRRAMRNLHGALAEKLAHAKNDELMHRIAGLLDEVTQKIERS